MKNLMNTKIKVPVLAGLLLTTTLITTTASALSVSGSPDKRVQVGQEWTFQPSIEAKNPDVSINVANKPDWMKLDEATGKLYGTPSQADQDVYKDIIVSISTGEKTTELKAFDVKVVNKAPSITGKPSKKVAVGAHYKFMPKACDINGDTISFKIKNKPAWASFDPKTGTLYGSPTASDKGKYNVIKIGAFDGKRTRWSRLFSINVVDDTQQIAAFEH